MRLIIDVTGRPSRRDKSRLNIGRPRNTYNIILSYRQPVVSR